MGSVHVRVGALVLVVALALTGLVGGRRATAVGEGVPVVYVADGVGYADALVGAVLAASHNAPLVTVENPREGDSIPEATAAELERLSPGSIVVFGGPVAVSEKVVEELQAYTSGSVTRLFGETRFGTATAIAEALPDKVANADKLDGKDSSAFLSRSQATAMVPRVFAQRDPDESGQLATDTTGVTVNSVPVNVPTDGVLVIQGTVYVKNEGKAPKQFVLDPRLDGTSTEPAGRAALSDAAPDGTSGARVTLSYTVTVNATAGSHTVDQVLRPLSGTADLFYNQQSLTVQFVPGEFASLS